MTGRSPFCSLSTPSTSLRTRPRQIPCCTFSIPTDQPPRFKSSPARAALCHTPPCPPKLWSSSTWAFPSVASNTDVTPTTACPKIELARSVMYPAPLSFPEPHKALVNDLSSPSCTDPARPQLQGCAAPFVPPFSKGSFRRSGLSSEGQMVYPAIATKPPLHLYIPTNCFTCLPELQNRPNVRVPAAFFNRGLIIFPAR